MRGTAIMRAEPGHILRVALMPCVVAAELAYADGPALWFAPAELSSNADGQIARALALSAK